MIQLQTGVNRSPPSISRNGYTSRVDDSEIFDKHVDAFRHSSVTACPLTFYLLIQPGHRYCSLRMKPSIVLLSILGATVPAAPVPAAGMSSAKSQLETNSDIM